MSNRVDAPVRSTVPAPSAALPLPIGFDFAFDARWDAWVARGNEHEKAMRRKVVMALPLFAATAIAATYLLAR